MTVEKIVGKRGNTEMCREKEIKKCNGYIVYLLYLDVNKRYVMLLLRTRRN